LYLPLLLKIRSGDFFSPVNLFLFSNFALLTVWSFIFVSQAFSFLVSPHSFLLCNKPPSPASSLRQVGGLLLAPPSTSSLPPLVPIKRCPEGPPLTLKGSFFEFLWSRTWIYFFLFTPGFANRISSPFFFLFPFDALHFSSV